MGVPEGIISFDEFIKVKFVVGFVSNCVYHENADELLVLAVEVGEDQPRMICAGLRAHYKPEQLIGKRVIVTANLKSRKLRGKPSQGRLLAAADKGDGRIRVVTIDDDDSISPGSKVKLK